MGFEASFTVHRDSEDHEDENAGDEVLGCFADDNDDEGNRVDHARNHCMPPRTSAGLGGFPFGAPNR